MAKEKKTESNTNNLSWNTLATLLLKDDIDLMNRELSIKGKISLKKYSLFDRQLKLMENMSEKTVTIQLSSPGGDPDAMFAFIDRIRTSTVKINIVAVGQVCSAAIPVLAAGTGVRTSRPNTLFMHHGVSYAHPYGRLAEQANFLRAANACSIRGDKFLATVTNKGQAFWTALGKNVDHYFYPETALEYGLVDEIK